MLTMAFNTPGWTVTPVRFTLPLNLQSSRNSSSHPAWHAKVWRATICVPATDTGSEPAARMRAHHRPRGRGGVSFQGTIMKGGVTW